MKRLFHNQTYSMYDEFIVFAKKCSDSPATAERLYNLLPDSIRNSTVLKDKLTNIVRYQYGEPYDRLENDQIVIGTPQYPCLLNLYLGIKSADKYLNISQIGEYLNRLTDQSKHNEVLFEMRPVLSIYDPTFAKFEVSGYGNGNKTIDWLFISGSNKINLLVEVKYRQKSLIEYFKILSSQGEEPPKPIPPDPNDIFKNTLGKFRSCDNTSTLQGVWANTQIKEDEGRLLTCFKALDNTKIHFLILSDWKDDAYVLARDESQKEWLKQAFNYIDSRRFVCDYEK